MQLYTFTPLYLCSKYSFYSFCRCYTDDTDSGKMALKCSRRLTSSGCLSIIPVIKKRSSKGASNLLKNTFTVPTEQSWNNYSHVTLVKVIKPQFENTSSSTDKSAEV